jgi:hypothetical protein
MTRQQDVLAYLGEALLAAQIVERFVAFMLAPSVKKDTEGVLEAFASKSKAERHVALQRILKELQRDGRSVPALDAELRKFLKERNKLVHRFHEIDTWDFRKERDCDACVVFLKGFMERAGSLNHLFVSALSVRSVHYGVRISKAASERYANDVKTIYSPLTIRWAKRIDA